MTITNVSAMLKEMDDKRNSVMVHDDRTFSNRITEVGHWMDGYYQCYKDMLAIINEYAKETT